MKGLEHPLICPYCGYRPPGVRVIHLGQQCLCGRCRAVFNAPEMPLGAGGQLAVVFFTGLLFVLAVGIAAGGLWLVRLW